MFVFLQVQKLAEESTAKVKRNLLMQVRASDCFNKPCFAKICNNNFLLPFSFVFTLLESLLYSVIRKYYSVIQTFIDVNTMHLLNELIKVFFYLEQPEAATNQTQTTLTFTLQIPTQTFL